MFTGFLPVGRIAVWQVASSVAVLIAGVSIRIFVLQHDCGHASLFGSKRLNDGVGTMLSWWTGVPFAPWRTEHQWHHTHQGKLDKRGVNRVNSPMTVRAARSDPKSADQRRRFISLSTVMVVGAWSLLVKRKRLTGFFHFRPGFPNRVPSCKSQVRGMLLTLLPYATATDFDMTARIEAKCCVCESPHVQALGRG